MTSPLQRQPHDLGVHSIAPTRRTDPRVRMAAEDALAADISAAFYKRVQQPAWLNYPSLSFESNRRLAISVQISIG